MRVALIDQSGKVVQAIVLGTNWQIPTSADFWQPPPGFTVVMNDNAAAGWTYDGKTFTAPPQPVNVATPLPPDPVIALQAALVAKSVITNADVSAAAAALAAKPV